MHGSRRLDAVLEVTDRGEQGAACRGLKGCMGEQGLCRARCTWLVTFLHGGKKRELDAGVFARHCSWQEEGHARKGSNTRDGLARIGSTWT